MPTIRIGGATNADIFSNLQFADIPATGAILNAWVSGDDLDTYGISVGDRAVVAGGTECNIELSADVIDTNRDQVVFNEVVGGGHIFVPVTAATEIQVMVHIRYL